MGNSDHGTTYTFMWCHGRSSPSSPATLTTYILQDGAGWGGASERVDEGLPVTCAPPVVHHQHLPVAARFKLPAEPGHGNVCM